MGKVLSVITRPIKNFNIESRAHKIISKDKPTPAPIYKVNLEEAERLLKENPDSFDELMKKDTTLDTHLKEVYVKSHDTIVDTKKTRLQSVDRPLPLNRRIVEQSDFGFYEPNKIHVGRCTLRQALKFLTSHLEDPATWNSTKIAIDYKIPEDTTKNILEHFRIYKVHLPDKKSKLVIAEPSVPKKHLENLDLKKLLEDDKDKDKNK